MEDKLLQEVVPIVILCAVIALVVRRLPRVDVGHTDEFRRRRVLNWLPLGLTYAFLYMGRYNVNSLVDRNLLTHSEFGNIDSVGAMVYGIAFLLNGPLTDRWGGRVTILIAAGGSAACNLAIGLIYMQTGSPPSVAGLMVLNAVNMYFQSFGAVSIVKVNASWFHLRERGTFGGIFGILISLGLYFAYDLGARIVDFLQVEWLFWIPAILLFTFFILSAIFVRNNPSDAGFEDFDLGDATQTG